MRYLRERLSWLLIGVFCLLLGVSSGNLSAEPATVDEAAWFDGAWTVGPAPVEGMETIVTGKPQNSVIRHLEGNKIEREITLRGTLHVMQFEVQAFGGNFPWWGANGGNYVAKKRDEDSFLLAPVSSMGKAEWDRGWLYQRVKPTTE